VLATPLCLSVSRSARADKRCGDISCIERAEYRRLCVERCHPRSGGWQRGLSNGQPQIAACGQREAHC